MTYILYVAAILAGFVFKKSRLCTGFIYIVMVLLAGFRTRSADLANYMLEYIQASEDVSKFTRYIGYFLFQKFFVGIGLEFDEYLIMVYIIGFLLLIISVRMLTVKVNYVLALYLIYSFALDAIQIKSLLAEVFALLGIVLLLKKHKTDEPKKMFSDFKGTIIPIIIIFIGGLFHFSSMLYVVCAIIYVLVQYKKKIMSKIYIICGVAVLFVISGGISYIFSIANSLGILGDMTYLSYWTNVNTRLGWIIPASWVLLDYFVCRYISSRNNIFMENNLKNAIVKFSMLVVLIIPFLLLDVTMCRLMRVFIILQYVLVANEKFTSRQKLTQFASYVAFLICIIFSVWYEILPVYDGTLGALLRYNSLLR